MIPDGLVGPFFLFGSDLESYLYVVYVRVGVIILINYLYLKFGVDFHFHALPWKHLLMIYWCVQF